MDKKQIDYAKLNQERIITIADLIRAIIRKLWVVVAAAVIFAAIFGGYKYAKDSKAASNASESTTDMKVKLDDDAQAEVNNVTRNTAYTSTDITRLIVKISCVVRDSFSLSSLTCAQARIP